MSTAEQETLKATMHNQREKYHILRSPKMLSCLEETSQSMLRSLHLKTQGIAYLEDEKQRHVFCNCEINLVTFTAAEIKYTDKKEIKG